MRRITIVTTLLILGALLRTPGAEAEIRPRTMGPLPYITPVEAMAEGAVAGGLIGVGVGITGSLAGLEGAWVMLGPCVLAGTILGFASVFGGERDPMIIFERSGGRLGSRLEDVPGDRYRLGLVTAGF